MASKGCLDGKAIVVTGAGRGIGREIALLAAKAGAKVVVNDLGGSAEGEGADQAPARQVVAEIAALGGTAVACGDSVADAKGADAIVKTALEAFGRLD
ncbi:MAG TPA: SDR family NAD(P)-dependent oxidoreductase, partial [Stellaceae bacterium]|nr:SDR family NAD(P)-dependent oxidoreductase [Stellaceae bacterium]